MGIDTIDWYWSFIDSTLLFCVENVGLEGFQGQENVFYLGFLVKKDYSKSVGATQILWQYKYSRVPLCEGTLGTSSFGN